VEKKFEVGIEKVNHAAVETSKNLKVSLKRSTRSTTDTTTPWWQTYLMRQHIRQGGLGGRWISTNKEVSRYSSEEVRVEGKNRYHGTATNRHAVVSVVVEKASIRRW